MMAMGKKPQGNPWIAAALVFIVLFLIMAVVAVVLYLNYDKQVKLASELQNQREELISDRQWSTRGAIIGSKPPRQSYVGLLLGYIDDVVYSILGSPREETSAEVKVQKVKNKIAELAASINEDYPELASVDVNTVGLLGLLSRIKNKLDSTVTEVAVLKEQLNQLQQKFDDVVKISEEKERALLEEKEKLVAKANQIQQSYDQLKALMDKNAQEQVKVLLTDLEQEREQKEQLNQELLKTQAQLKVASEMLKDAREQLRKVVGSPDMEVAIYKGDGQIILLDEHSKTVHIDLGSKDHVYPGLTFSVYDKHTPIPPDGKGKAEIEVFDVSENVSTARIIKSNPLNPILEGDVIANLVWDSDQTNIFVVAGDFDLDGDGITDYEAENKIKALIENWDGKVEDAVTVNTDFVILGIAPTVLPRPTYDQIAIDPLAMEKYEKSLERLERYRKVKQQAQELAIPILNYERFLYLIGYKTQSARPGAFGS